MGEDFDYAEEFKTLDLDALKRDIFEVMTTSQDWWPADYGHYGPLLIRMTWHAAGTYRIHDGRGGGGSGQQRFAPLNSWPDNANLDKARRLLWPVKQKYGRKISWADLIVFAGNCAYESMGFTPFGFGFGREDVWEPDEVIWGPEDTWLGDERYSGERELANPLGAVQMGLIYVNPEGPNGNPDPLASARDIRETFARMAMDDEETVALIIGGHTVGKCHGAGDPDLVGPEPEGCPVEHMGIGWKSTFGTGKGSDTITSGLEGAWTNEPTKWDNGYLDNLYNYDYELTKSPAGANQWKPKNPEAQDTVPDAHDPSKRHAPMMLTTDLALKLDPIYGPISKRFHENPDQLADAFAKAWYKLLHRDMGPVSRYLGPWVPEPQLWQDPVPAVDHDLIGEQRHRGAQEQDPRLGTVDLAAGRHRVGFGGHLPRHRQAGRCERCTDPPGATEGLGGQRAGGTRQGAADPRTDPAGLQRLTVRRDEGLARRRDRPGWLRGRRASGEGRRPRRHGSVRARVARTRRRSKPTSDAFAVLEPTADGFRNYLGDEEKLPPEQRLLDRANLLKLSAPEMTVLVGGMRALNANCGGAAHGVFTDRPETLTNDFFVNLLDMDTEWKTSDRDRERVRGSRSRVGRRQVDRHRGRPRLRCELRSSARSRRSTRCDDAKEKFVRDFVAAWDKVMNLDRFDLATGVTRAANASTAGGRRRCYAVLRRGPDGDELADVDGGAGRDRGAGSRGAGGGQQGVSRLDHHLGLAAALLRFGRFDHPGRRVDRRVAREPEEPDEQRVGNRRRDDRWRRPRWRKRSCDRSTRRRASRQLHLGTPGSSPRRCGWRRRSIGRRLGSDAVAIR